MPVTSQRRALELQPRGIGRQVEVQKANAGDGQCALRGRRGRSRKESSSGTREQQWRRTGWSFAEATRESTAWTGSKDSEHNPSTPAEESWGATQSTNGWDERDETSHGGWRVSSGRQKPNHRARRGPVWTLKHMSIANELQKQDQWPREKQVQVELAWTQMEAHRLNKSSAHRAWQEMYPEWNFGSLNWWLLQFRNQERRSIPVWSWRWRRRVF